MRELDERRRALWMRSQPPKVRFGPGPLIPTYPPALRYLAPMRSAAGVVARLYVRGLLPSRLARGVFWRLAPRDERILHDEVTATVRLGRGSMTLRLALGAVGNWDLLFNATSRSSHAANLVEFDRLIQSAGCVLDIGANVGIYTYWAALNAPDDCLVIAVEANPDLADNIIQNLRAHGASTGEVITAAVTDKSEDVTLHVGHLDLVSSIDSEHVQVYGGSSHSVVVAGITIDALVNQRGVRPDVIKIDVEGHELAVLHGALDTLRELHPAILVEIVQANGPAVHEMLTELGYRGRRFDGHKLQPVADCVVPDDVPYGDFLYERA